MIERERTTLPTAGKLPTPIRTYSKTNRDRNRRQKRTSIGENRFHQE
jgi:hypothetical protein